MGISLGINIHTNIQFLNTKYNYYQRSLNILSMYSHNQYKIFPHNMFKLGIHHSIFYYNSIYMQYHYHNYHISLLNLSNYNNYYHTTHTLYYYDLPNNAMDIQVCMIYYTNNILLYKHYIIPMFHIKNIYIYIKHTLYLFHLDRKLQNKFLGIYMMLYFHYNHQDKYHSIYLLIIIMVDDNFYNYNHFVHNKFYTNKIN